MTVKKKFRAVLETDSLNSRATFIVVPFDVEKTFGTKARVPVRGTINGYAFRSSISPYGGVHYLGVSKALRAGPTVSAGDTVEVVMERDEEPRVVRPPADFARAIKANPSAQASWERLSYTHRKEYARAVEEAKKPETQARRIEKAVAELIAREHPAG
jgi:Domain of unknown function (DUF1905)/Bacteriocin-protection, YdeI or OmpD-Associated